MKYQWKIHFFKRLEKMNIKMDLENGLPNGKYFVNNEEVTLKNINKFSLDQLSQASFENTCKIMTDSNIENHL